MPSSRYTLMTTSHAVVREGSCFAALFLTDLSIENWSCINSFTRSIGATAVFANAPAHAPAMQSLTAFFDFDILDGGCCEAAAILADYALKALLVLAVFLPSYPIASVSGIGYRVSCRGRPCEYWSGVDVPGVIFSGIVVTKKRGHIHLF